MTLTRLLAAALVLCSLPAFTQDQPKPGHLAGHVYSSFPCLAPSATPEEPWRIVPSRPADLGAAQAPLNQLSLNQPGVECNYHVSFTRKGYAIPGNLQSLGSCSQLPDADATCHMVRAYFPYMLSNGQPASVDLPVNGSDMVGPTCYTIRGYVVARDSKDSDSTHPVSYSTCQPAARYQLRTTEIRSGSADR